MFSSSTMGLCILGLKTANSLLIVLEMSRRKQECQESQYEGLGAVCWSFIKRVSSELGRFRGIFPFSLHAAFPVRSEKYGRMPFRNTQIPFSVSTQDAKRETIPSGIQAKESISVPFMFQTARDPFTTNWRMQELCIPSSVCPGGKDCHSTSRNRHQRRYTTKTHFCLNLQIDWYP
ncbi:hypothetical protein C0J52_03092 [Blattella germanica]|nr:hypothetical protein C0J52_03092 [Blattella germanica]